MNAVVWEHVPVSELPQAWRERLGLALARTQDAWVTVRIEQEAQEAGAPEAFVTDDPAFGIWRDREDVADVQGYVRRIRAARFNRDGSRNELP
jgi:hypothetical protein